MCSKQERINIMRSSFFGLLVSMCVCGAGCSRSELASLEGKIVVQGASSFSFAGDVLELRLEGDTLQRAFGEIKPDGTFELETLDDGSVKRGLKPGAYQARVVFSDDDPKHPVEASKAIHRKYTRFETSGLKIEVPSEDVTLKVSAK
jgi:hypothetical protein